MTERDSTKIDAGFLDLIRGADGFDVFDGELLDAQGNRIPDLEAPQRYVLVHSNRGLVRADRFTGPARRRRKTYWVHSVGLTKHQAERVAERVLSRILDVRLQVDGWRCDPIQHAASQPVQADITRKPARYVGVDQFDLYASPSA